MDGTNPSSEGKNFKMQASTESTYYRETTTNINYGIVRRGVDLSLSTNIVTSAVSMNEKTTTYSYKQPENNGDEITSDKVSYNQYLYASDYHTRIDDYVGNAKVTDKEMNSASEEDLAKVGNIDDLKVDVTYKIELKIRRRFLLSLLNKRRVEY